MAEEEQKEHPDWQHRLAEAIELAREHANELASNLSGHWHDWQEESKEYRVVLALDRLANFAQIELEAHRRRAETGEPL